MKEFVAIALFFAFASLIFASSPALAGGSCCLVKKAEASSTETEDGKNKTETLVDPTE